jgi:zinc protease
MTRRVLSLALLAALLSSTTSAAAVDRSAPPPLAPVAPFALPVPQTFTLKNGLTVHFIERHRAPLVDIVVSIGAGALHDPPGREGTATGLADLLSQGAGGRDAFLFDDAVQGIGGRVSINADWNRTTISAQALSSRTEDLVALVADVVLRPRLDVNDWQRKQQERLGELAYSAGEPRALAGLAAARALFPTGRQGTGVIGTPRSVSSITVDELKAWHATLFRPDNAFVVVVGDLDARRAATALETSLGGWKAPTTTLSKASAQEPAPLEGTRVVLVDRPGAPQSVVQVVAPIPADIGPFDAAAGVMTTLLGGSFTSRLNANLREKNQFAYGAGYSYDVSPAHRSRVSTSVKSAVTEPAIAEILAELARIREPAPAAEVERARAYEALTFPAVLDGGSGLAEAWTSWLELGVRPEVASQYMKVALAVDATAVQAAATRLVDPGRVVIVVVGDARSLAGPLQRFGPVSTITAGELLPAP